MKLMKMSDFKNFEKSAEHGPRVAIIPASATRKTSALHPCTKQKFRINVADPSLSPIVGPWHKRLNKKPKPLYILLECNIRMKVYFSTFSAFFYQLSLVLTFISATDNSVGMAPRIQYVDHHAISASRTNYVQLRSCGSVFHNHLQPFVSFTVHSH